MWSSSPARHLGDDDGPQKAPRDWAASRQGRSLQTTAYGFSRRHIRISLCWARLRTWVTCRQFQGLPVSEAAVHRPSQVWHSVHTHCLCPQDRRHSGLPLGSVAAACGEDAHGLLVSEEGLGNILPRASGAIGACRRDSRMCPRDSGASEDWSYRRVHFLPFWNKTGLPQEIHTKMWIVISQQKQQPGRKYQLQVAILCAVF